jgi:TP53 regulating kinase-like protein
MSLTAEDLKKLANTSHVQLLNGFELIKQGAEAKIYTGRFENQLMIAKERFKKSYRHPELDKSLIKKRIKNETKLLTKAGLIGVNVPKVFQSDTENGIILMEFIQDSITCRELFINLYKSIDETLNKDDILKSASTKIGQVIGLLHKNDIVHGDLTTSNMLIKTKASWNDFVENNIIYFIDFGLSFISSTMEDKAVDLYVLERAILSTHSNQADKIFQFILDSYSKEYSSNSSQVLDRLDQVRLRGRKRTMIG